MKNVIGIALLFVGITGYLHGWICRQKEQQSHLENLIRFLQKSIFAMETEKVRIIEYFENYSCKDSVLEETLREVAKRLSQNIYPKGQSVWEEVLMEEEQNWNFDEETFGVVLRAGNGFFGRNREENICFLQKSLRELEMQKEKMKDKHTRERKVWIPVGMLGGIMLVIILI